MPNSPQPPVVVETIDAKVCDVLPQFGLAYAQDAHDRMWVITRQTPGSPGNFDQLQTGAALRLDIGRVRNVPLVTHYQPVPTEGAA